MTFKFPSHLSKFFVTLPNDPTTIGATCTVLMFHILAISLLSSPLNLSLSQQQNTQTLGAARFKPSVRFIQVKTKRYMPYHRNVIYNPSNIQVQKQLDRKLNKLGSWNNSWVKNLSVRPLAPRRKTPDQLYPIKKRSPGKDQLNRN